MACATSSSGWRVCLFHHVGRKNVEPAVGFEPTTCRLQGGCSWPAELSGQFVYDVRPLNSREERERASKYGAENGVRTRDIEFGRLALCLLSYIRKFRSE